MAEEGIIITRSSTATTFKTVTPWPFMIPTPPGISVLWDGDDLEIVNREIAGAFDATYEPVKVGTRRAVTALVFGDYNTSGAAVTGLSSQRAQLKTNMKHLRDNVVAPVATAPSVITVELLGPGGSSLGTKNAQIVGPLRPVEMSPICVAVTLDLLLTEGAFSL